MAATSSNLSLSITNPLVLYRALIATRRIRPDPAQHRLALELQQLYYRLKDYDPEVEYRWRLEKAARLSRKLNQSQPKNGTEQRKAVFEKSFSLSSIFGLDDRASLMALTRTVPVHSSAMEIDSPQGMLLYGEVGRGKSMLLDLLYSSLPTKKKRRWHYNTFVLDMFRRLELARIERANSLGLEYEHVVLSLARDTMETSPILFLDEFQMPDKVSANLVHNFFTGFFSLGGVLVASSNRMPEELAKAAGLEFAKMGGVTRWGKGSQILEKLSLGQKTARADFGQFVELLKKRCEIWEMEGERDWRREDGQVVADAKTEAEIEEIAMDANEATLILDRVDSKMSSSEVLVDDQSSADMPAHYHIADPPSSEIPIPGPSESLQAEIARVNPSGIWQSSTLTVYARQIILTATSPENGCALLPFSQLCATNLGPADYISICSHFHTLIVTDIPILTLLAKNEARRFITFLDACYEARCRLLIEAAAPPDRLFFPETRARFGTNVLAEGDSIESEAFSEMYQDSTAPFRPNISSYVGHNADERQNPSFTPVAHQDVRSVLADEDADFGPTYGNRRSSGISSSAADYDSDGSELSQPGRPAGMSELELRQGPDFTQGAGIFTGQDEQFAYKRARSRLWEICGRKWWDERKRDPAEWWTPVQTEGRFWEAAKAKAALLEEIPDSTHDGRARRTNVEVNMGKEKEDELFRHGASPFRVDPEPPPTFGWQHAWGMVSWGKKAGEWGKGVDAKKKKEENN